MKAESIMCTPVLNADGTVRAYQWRLEINSDSVDNWKLEKHQARFLRIEKSQDFEKWEFSLSYRLSVRLMYRLGNAITIPGLDSFKLTLWCDETIDDLQKPR